MLFLALVWLLWAPFLVNPEPLQQTSRWLWEPITSAPRTHYGTFPKPNDPFRFLPCTNLTVPPPLDDDDPEARWTGLFDPDPSRWSWGRPRGNPANAGLALNDDAYGGRGIYLCGYLDVPLDYTTASDARIARLAVTLFQVSGLRKSDRTIVVEPGGPGGSGTWFTWDAAENITQRLSDGKFDVLGWDPRGVNTSQPAIACFPHGALRDRWALLRRQYREESADPDKLLAVADAMNEAMLQACWNRHGDIPRFVSTAFVARDLDAIRSALGEEELTGYLVSYGSGIGQTYANMFPDRVGRLIFEGLQYVRDQRQLGGFGWTALDNVTDAWHDGFLGECLHAGPEHCFLARPVTGLQKESGRSSTSSGLIRPVSFCRNVPVKGDAKAVTMKELEARMDKLLSALLLQPMPAYTEASGPSLVTYSALVMAMYNALYDSTRWPELARTLYELEEGNATLAADLLYWEYDPSKPSAAAEKPRTEELTYLVICADAYDAPKPDDGLAWWKSLWANMTAKSWIAGNSRFFSVLPCRHFSRYWPKPAEVYRGDLNHTLKHPVLLIATTYDPATPLRNGRRLFDEMTRRNARLVVNHGYGHGADQDASDCADRIAKEFILHGTLPEANETSCYANERPYLRGLSPGTDPGACSTDGIQRPMIEAQ